MVYDPRQIDLESIQNIHNVNGYMRCRFPLGHPKKRSSAYYHRLVMEKHLGRILSDVEIVHHKDANPLNNSIENLILCNGIKEYFKQEQITRKYLANKGVKFKYTMSESAMNARKKGATLGGRKPYEEFDCNADWIKIQYLQKKRSFRNIGEELGWHKNKVKKYLMSLNVPLRNHKEQTTIANQQ